MEKLPHTEEKEPSLSERAAAWLSAKVTKLRDRLPTALGNPKLYLAALGMAGSLSDMQAQSHRHSQPFVDLPVNEHFLDGDLDKDDVIGAIFAPVAYEMNLGSGDDLHQFVVDFVYGGKDFDVTQMQDSSQLESMQDELTESLRETFTKEFFSLYGPFLHGHMAEGFLENWERTDLGMEFLGTISSMKITGSASPEAKKYGSEALDGKSVQNENIELAKKRAGFVKTALSRLFEEAGVSEVLIDIEVIGEEQQFSSQEMEDLYQVAGELGFDSVDTLGGVHALLMLYNNPDNRATFSEDQLETMREVVDSKRTVEIEIVREGGDTKKVLIPLPVLLLLFGMILRRVFRKKERQESESEIEPEAEIKVEPEPAPEPEAGSRVINDQGVSLEVGTRPADTRVFSETVTTSSSVEQLTDAVSLEQGNLSRVFARTELAERMYNPEAIERGLDYRAELALAANQYQTRALRPELESIEPDLRKELDKVMPSVAEWHYAVKNLQNEKRFAEGGIGLGVSEEKQEQFKKRGKRLAKQEKELKQDVARIYTQLEQILATKVVNGWSKDNTEEEISSITGRFVAARMSRELSGERQKSADEVWRQVISQPDVDVIMPKLEQRAASAVWGYAIPMSSSETVFEERLVSSEVREDLEEGITQHILAAWQKHDRSFDTAKTKTSESLLGGDREEDKLVAREDSLSDASDGVGDVIKKQRESFVRLQRLRYPASEMFDEDQGPVRLREVSHSESSKIKMWGEFWAKKVAGPIVERAVASWVQSLRLARNPGAEAGASLADFIETEVKIFVAEHSD